MMNIRQRQQPMRQSPRDKRQRKPLFTRKRLKGRGRRQCIIFIAFSIVVGFCIVYLNLFLSLLNSTTQTNDAASPIAPNSRPGLSSLSKEAEDKNTAKSKHKRGRRFQDWMDIATKLAALPPNEVIDRLNAEDPFATRKFGRDLIEKESQLERSLTIGELQELFSCPIDRITLPDMRDNVKAEAFRNGEEGTFLFFQHLRKAGGTHFCSLAKKNLPSRAINRYYCMPDMEWDQQGAGYLHHYSNDEIVSNMKRKGYRVAGNEWDQFRHGEDGFFNLPALFATSFRSPLDRAVSQFRFECLEDRGCHMKTIEEYWTKRADLRNVYTWTFSDHRGRLNKAYHGSTKEEIDKRVTMVRTALDTVARFNLVLAMEWLAYASPLVQEVLGFENTEQLTHRVRPHNGQGNLLRNDGQEENKMGSASIAKASYDAKAYLKPHLYNQMSQDLALDEILTDAARRMFLERLVCNDV